MINMNNCPRYSVCTRDTPPVELFATPSKQAAHAYATPADDVWDWATGKVVKE